ncbi:hypothetical protein BGC_28940 [Burkholderia sp. 3C]
MNSVPANGIRTPFIPPPKNRQDIPMRFDSPSAAMQALVSRFPGDIDRVTSPDLNHAIDLTQ